MKDFTKSNKWTNFMRRLSKGSKNEQELADYISLLEKQIVELERMVIALEDDKI